MGVEEGHEEMGKRTGRPPIKEFASSASESSFEA